MCNKSQFFNFTTKPSIMKKTTPLILTFLLFISTITFAQNGTISQPELDSGSIEQQFDYIISKSANFKDFQLIRRSSILKVKDHALDSIRAIRKELINANKSSKKISNTISQLENKIQTLKNEVEVISKEVDSISFFGKLLSKSTYNAFVWSIILVLLLGLILFIIRFKNSTTITKRSKNILDKVEAEFESFRKLTLKKEQETMRKLQDEINKNNP